MGPPIPYAPNVYAMCLRRKKTCDKTLPACGYCARNGIQCEYNRPQHEKRSRQINPGRHFVALTDFHLEAHPGQAPLHDSIDFLIDQRMHQILAVLRMHPAEITMTYMNSFHQWMPIVSADVFQVEPAQPRPADVSILLLAMCTVIPIPGLSTRLVFQTQIDY
ncbi:uncharacterized protein N7483_006129 [Penicillium malachiteum]|uniref:uncharacterized protein n=1 Tax=Penicillium malachiteum TaxID=1324776 RepID=UPI002549110B|nr:uncharacterized protein N7483_006129 [Penicillium malachiteum]KAJ5731621.1 hypothetical protein N7483_006129 [Penicillium malachiteum]